MRLTICSALLLALAAGPLHAQETRETAAHVYGVSTLELAIEHGILEINIVSPGMDIVGFEYEASANADKDTVEAAIRAMLVPEDIVTLPKAAECRLTEVLAHLHGKEHQEGDDEMNEASDAHEDDAGHSEFHARYKFACERPEEVTVIGLPFFERFTNAQEIEATYVTETTSGAAEIARDSAELILN